MARAEGSSRGEPIDVAVLARLIGPQPAMLADFYVDFARSAADAMLAIEQALAAGSRGAAESVAHRLKGSARLIGAAALGDHCECLEESCQGSSDDVMQSAFQVVQEEAKRVREWIETGGGTSCLVQPTGFSP